MEALHVPAHIVQSDRVDRGDTHRSVELRLYGPDLGSGLVPETEDLAARLVELGALRRDDQRTLRPVDQRGAHLGFELRDGLAGRGLRHEVVFGATGEAAMPDDVAVQAERLQMH